MNWLPSIPKYSQQLAAQVIFLEAKPSQSYCEHLQEWLNEAKNEGATTWFLSCNRNKGGPWAGLNEFLNHLSQPMQAYAPELLIKHDYELTHVLPSLRKTISTRYLNLTDTALEEPPSRTYSADRVFRVINGIVDLLTAWYKRSNYSAWVIVCDSFEHSPPLVRRFFVELMRRRSKQMNLTLVFTTDLGGSEIMATLFNPEYLRYRVRLNLPESANTLVCKKEIVRLLQEIEFQAEKDEIELETNLPQLIYYLLLSEQQQKALIYQIRACSIYTKRGWYEDALIYGEAALSQLEHYCPEDSLKRAKIIRLMYISYTALNQAELAMLLLKDAMNKITDPIFFCRSCYMMAMLHARYLPNKNFAEAQSYLDQGLKQLEQLNLPNSRKLLWVSALRRGVALIQHREGKNDEAIKLGLSSYEALSTEFGSNQHLLDQSIVLSTVARVYASIGSYKQAITYFTDLISLDKNYSDYYNERGSIYLKMGLLDDAVKDYFKAIELSPPYPEVWTNLAQSYRLMNRMAEALDAYSVAIDLDPSQELALLGRAQVLHTLGQLEEALIDYNAALVLNPAQPLILANRATLYHANGHLLNALEDLDRAIILSSEIPDLYHNRAIVLIELGRFDDAIRDLRTYLALSPDSEERLKVERKLTNLIKDC